jgi:short-chain Z-isoprenyl diphosphate synthase
VLLYRGALGSAYSGNEMEARRINSHLEPAPWRRRFRALTEGPPRLGLWRAPYYFYERWLLRQIAQGPVPRHVGVILDGNRRHAQAVALTDAREIYELGARKLDDVLDWCAELKIRAVTLWVFSPDNLNRPQDELSGIFHAIEAKLTALIQDPQIHSRRVRVRAIGDVSLVPEKARTAIRAIEQATSTYDAMELNIAIGYGGRQEIVDAVRAALTKIAAEGASLSTAIDRLTSEAIAAHLYTAGLPDPDLIIRTSGEVRLSGFLLWQSAQSEFYFSDVNWPAFRRVDFLRAVREFQGRQRRYGL